MTTKSLPLKKTKIICTIGPASESVETLKLMIENGMNVARLNFAHGDYAGFKQKIDNIRAAAAAVGKRVAIMADLPGPKMRIGRLTGDAVELQRDQTFILQTEEIEGNSQRASMSFAGLPKAVKPGDRIFLSDGFIQLLVEKVGQREVLCNVRVGGELRSNKGVNFPGIDLGISAFTDQDRKLLQFAAEQHIDAISQSFVQGPEDIVAVREAAARLNYNPFIIAKIERSRAVENLDAILEVTDGIMVARGDLGVEIPIEEIAVNQKRIINRANLFAKPVITATHMLESMVGNRRPTRAEATDVANAIFDGTDCVMLSEETAMGRFPEEAVAVMSRIAQVSEPHANPEDITNFLEKAKVRGKISPEDLISLSIELSVEALTPSAIITPTMSGATARRLSRFRLPVWIVAVSPSEAVCQTLQFSYGVYPVFERERPESWRQFAYHWLRAYGLADGLAFLTGGTSTADVGRTNRFEVIELSSPPSETSIW
ncbi:MAG: pyruvate kinase [Anaerolineae bacterium]|nr:pyruvate kinase [Anaerolineae bacterium]